MRKMKMSAVVALLSGATLFQGCLGQYFSWIAQGLPGTLIAEWLLDNDSVFDLFEDGAEAAAE